MQTTIGSKIPFTPKCGTFCGQNFLRYLDLYYVNPADHKLETFPLLQAVNQSEASRNCFRKICHLWGKGYFAAVGTYEYLGQNILIFQSKSVCSLILKYLCIKLGGSFHLNTRIFNILIPNHCQSYNRYRQLVIPSKYLPIDWYRQKKYTTHWTDLANVNLYTELQNSINHYV